MLLRELKEKIMTEDTKAALLTLIVAINDGSIISNNKDYFEMIEKIEVTKPCPFYK